MFKFCLILALAIAGVCAQEAAPEPYSYGYETDTHAAAEQRDPSGKVTGYYTLVDNDGRQRRVEYVADESGFRAKVQTNEVGTKSENSADVEVLAAPPTREQLVYQQTPVVQQQQQQRVVSQQVVASAPQRTGVAYNQQQYGYYPGYSNYNGYNQYGYGAASGLYGYGLYDNGVYGGYNNGQYAGYNNGQYASYNNHLPSSYYRSQSVQSIGPVQSAGYGVVGTVGRSAGPVVSSTTQTRRTNYQTVGVAPTANYGYQTVGVAPSAGYGYQTVGYAPASGYSYQASAVPSSVGYSTSNLLGSSNYAVIQKREAADGNAPKKSAAKLGSA